MIKVTCFGEVLWDVFPIHKKIGGAPLNVALRLHSFGVDTGIVSRIGDDEDGKDISQYLDDHNMNTTFVQIDDTFKTGCVNVTLDSYGSATYDIEKPVAWDHIQLNEDIINQVNESDAFIFGSLVCRNKTSKNTLLQLIEHARFSVFDVNLRAPFYSIEVLVDLMKKADFIKCNDDEILEITKELGFISKSLEECMRFLSKTTKTDKICVTKGGNGALLFCDNQFFKNNGYKVIVADTVGAGDSFLASLVFKLLSKEGFQESLNFATAVGSIVASKKGANPLVSLNDVLSISRN